MPALDPTFSDFLLATNELVVTSPQEILNDAVKNTYFIAEMLRGREVAEVVRGGSKLTDRIMLSDNGSFEFYSPNDEFNPSSVDTLTKIELPWRFSKAHYAFSDEEILLNDGSDREVFKELKKAYTQSAVTSNWNGMEDALWAVPDTDTMEAATADPGVVYSIPALVTGDDTNFHANGFTNVMTVDPATESGWRNQLSEYDATAFDDAENGIFAAFDEMFLKVNFESPDNAQEYFENDRLRKMKIATSRVGRTQYSRLLRSANDRLISAQDPGYNDPTYAGIPVKYVADLDDGAARYNDPDDDTMIAEGTLPRYYWLNLEYMFPVFHARRYMTQIGPIPGGPRQPFSHVVYFNTYWQLFSRSRLRQGIVAPDATP